MRAMLLKSVVTTVTNRSARDEPQDILKVIHWHPLPNRHEMRLVHRTMVVHYLKCT